MDYETAIPVADVKEEYAYIRMKYNVADITGQTLLEHNNKKYDVIQFVTTDGTENQVIFDITSFFDKHNFDDDLPPDELFLLAITSVYRHQNIIFMPKMLAPDFRYISVLDDTLNITSPALYRQYLEQELSTIKARGIQPQFLIAWDIIDHRPLMVFKHPDTVTDPVCFVVTMANDIMAQKLELKRVRDMTLSVVTQDKIARFLNQ